MNIPIPRFLANWIFNKYGENLIRNQSQKASKIDKILISPGSGSARWSEHDYENFAKETYLKNIIAFRCIDILGTAFSSVPWKVYEVKGSNNKTETKEHPVAKLIKKPNPLDSFSFLMLKAISFLVMSGNTYSERVKLDTGPNKGVAKELYIHRPDRVHIEVNTDTGQLEGYVYEVQGRKVQWKVDPITMECDLWHFKTFHPINDWYGAAVTESAAREIDTSNEATEWNKKLLENEGRPGMVVTITGSNLSDEKFEKLEKMLLEKHSGVENVGRNLILEGEKGTKAEPYGWTPKDMDFIEGNNMLARRIALGFKVPPMLMGIPGDATFSNYEEARLAFWEEAIFFYLNFFRDELNAWFFPFSDKYFIDYALDDIPALAGKRHRMWERANKAQFITINEKRAMVSLPPVPDGGVILVPSNLIPLDMLLKEYEDGGSEDEDEGKVKDKLKKKGLTEEESLKLLGLKE